MASQRLARELQGDVATRIFLLVRLLAYEASSRSKRVFFGIVKEEFASARKIAFLFSATLSIA